MRTLPLDEQSSFIFSVAVGIGRAGGSHDPDRTLRGREGRGLQENTQQVIRDRPGRQRSPGSPGSAHNGLSCSRGAAGPSLPPSQGRCWHHRLAHLHRASENPRIQGLCSQHQLGREGCYPLGPICQSRQARRGAPGRRVGAQFPARGPGRRQEQMKDWRTEGRD